MNVFEAVKQSVTTRQAAEHFRLAVLPEPKNVFRIWQTKGLGA